MYTLKELIEGNPMIKEQNSFLISSLNESLSFKNEVISEFVSKVLESLNGSIQDRESLKWLRFNYSLSEEYLINNLDSEIEKEFKDLMEIKTFIFEAISYIIGLIPYTSLEIFFINLKINSQISLKK